MHYDLPSLAATAEKASAMELVVPRLEAHTQTSGGQADRCRCRCRCRRHPCRLPRVARPHINSVAWGHVVEDGDARLRIVHVLLSAELRSEILNCGARAYLLPGTESTSSGTRWWRDHWAVRIHSCVVLAHSLFSKASVLNKK